MTRARAKGKASVLARQKPRRTLGRGFPKLGKLVVSCWRPLALISLVAGLVIAAYSGLGPLLAPLVAWWTSPPPKIDWKVEMRVDGDLAPSDRRSEEMLRTARESLGHGSEADLRRTLNRLRAVDAFGMVRVVRIGPERVVVHVTPRRPVMCAEADRLRLVADTGEIYGVAGVEGAAPCSGPLLRGIPLTARKPTLSADLTLILEEDEAQAVRDALTLHNEAKAQGLALATISFNRYRGFNATMIGSTTEITLGHAPFTDKLSKLRTILTNLERKGEIAARIELDYHGKAFVKLRNI